MSTLVSIPHVDVIGGDSPSDELLERLVNLLLELGDGEKQDDDRRRREVVRARREHL